ncbi:uncharacterized protein LOC131889792 isoform X2 [Tigriopus californicus]|uniref:uncharacterized protein LOC131889792 isoform X2 n=1 Tax=Tigriopus californicus TaxID=6832 RepID=UPI0027DA8E65|nr:uncharacterized protein LOC131889792 isoform X2 [Tigriopus californicus]
MADKRHSAESNTGSLWSACDRGDTDAVIRLLNKSHRDVNARNCLGCTPLLYACGSGHLETVSHTSSYRVAIKKDERNFQFHSFPFPLTALIFAGNSMDGCCLCPQVRYLLTRPDIDVNRCNNDRLTSFMLAMQGGALIGKSSESSWPGWENQGSNAHEKMKRLIDLPATDDLEWTRHDRWTALMEACNFGHKSVVELLVQVPQIDFDAINLRGQRAQDVAISRGHDSLGKIIDAAKRNQDNPEELPRIQELEEKVQSLKIETRQRLVKGIEVKYAQMRDLKLHQESEICPLSAKIDVLQNQLEEAMKQRLTLITRHVREIKGVEDEIKQMKKKLDNFDMYTDLSTITSKSRLSKSTEHLDVNPFQAFEKDFECSVCLEEMKPPVKIFQCRNGHVLCETCKDHPEVNRCPSCRIPLNAQINLLRNLPMEKVARSYFEKVESVDQLSGRSGSVSSSGSPRPSFVRPETFRAGPRALADQTAVAFMSSPDVSQWDL